MSSVQLWVGSAIILAVVLDAALILGVRHLRKRNAPVAASNAQAAGQNPPAGAWFSSQRTRLRQALASPAPRHLLPLERPALRVAWRPIPWASVIELGVVVAWALWVGRRYLNFDPNVWLAGGDWPLNMEAYFAWPLVKQCGACVMWNGLINGGSPAFVELVAAMLHPVLVIGILLWGVVSATKVAVVASLVMAGVAQWWIAHTLRLGRLARLWSAALAVVGGHLAARMDNGLVEEVLAAGACSLAIAAALELAVRGRRRSVALLGLTLGLAVLAGQGYMQFALIFGVLPTFALFLFDNRLKLRPLWRSFFWAGVLAVLVSAVLWVPFLHFWPNFWKPTTEADFVSVPPPDNLLLNLVIRQPQVYEALQRADDLTGLGGTPAWFGNYIGWIPVALALVSVGFFPRRRWRVPASLLLGIALIYLLSGATLLRWLASVAPEFATRLRTPSVMTSVAVPLILGLAACGLDRLAKVNWPALTLTGSSWMSNGLSLKWLALGLPLIWSLTTAYTLGQRWMNFVESPLPFYPIIQPTPLVGQQWISTPFGESALVVVGLQANLKMTNVVRPWSWRDREAAPYYYEFTRDEAATAEPGYVGTDYGLNKVFHPDVQYAAVDTGSEQIPCQAMSQGGNIDVDCEQDVGGTLIVQENSWSGWSVRRDGNRAPLWPGQWLSTPAPAGTHHYEFRYRPWDVPLGLALSLLGLILTARVWFPLRRNAARHSQA
jgi:hypothetical protein